MTEIASARVGPMLNPPHPGELIREKYGRCRVERDRDGGASRLRARNIVTPSDGKAGVSANIRIQ